MDIFIYAAIIYSAVGLLVLWALDSQHFSIFLWLKVVLRVVFSILMWPLVPVYREDLKRNQIHHQSETETIEEE